MKVLRTIGIAIRQAHPIRKAFLLITLLGIVGVLCVSLTQADNQLITRSLQISNSAPTANGVSYVVSFAIQSGASIGSLRLQLCSNDPFPGTPCTAPTGLNLSGVVLASQTGETGFSIDPSSTANEIILTRVPAVASTNQATFTFTGATNPTNVGSYFGRYTTYASIDASGPTIDYGGIAWNINDILSVQSEVPPFLEFCTGIQITGADCSTASGDYINYGSLKTSQTSYAQSRMAAATNADNGYTVTLNGLPMISGNNQLGIMNDDVSRPGVSQFGLNLAANSDPLVGSGPSGPGAGTVRPNYGNPNIFRFVSGDVVASTVTSDYPTQFTASYVVNVASTDPVGVYTSTITYICLGSF